ncbi:hypothetical protein H072_7695 [Dactylellina haptotyla CBS 200.50]|uniref:Bromodomain associated domain-containing protein n=1 Tax=Dactylellina haptotyla (strain CBS 200.50) TaxID=1284197 RepID=S8A6V1_DACHA|nr:hypothetical protein H072_7695 [Dactylellina haptotyla CBS 200.50]
MDTPEQFYFSLLRISTAQMLRHAGLAGSRPSVLDSLTDITGRYLTLLGTTARTISESSNRTTSELSDVLSAMEHLGLLKPLTLYTPDPDDTRAIDNFITWAKSPEVEELRKLAGVITVEIDGGDEDAQTTEAGLPDTDTPTLNGQKDITKSNKQPSEKPNDSITTAATSSATAVGTAPATIETDIPIKREILDDQPASMMMDIDGVPLLEDSMNLPTRGLGIRDTEPPGDGEEESSKAKVRLKQVDWFTALRMKEDAARFKGTVLGKQDAGKKVVVEGGDSVPVELPGQLSCPAAAIDLSESSALDVWRLPGNAQGGGLAEVIEPKVIATPPTSSSLVRLYAAQHFSHIRIFSSAPKTPSQITRLAPPTTDLDRHVLFITKLKPSLFCESVWESAATIASKPATPAVLPAASKDPESLIARRAYGIVATP